MVHLTNMHVTAGPLYLIFSMFSDCKIMWPVIINFVRTYAPYIVWPAAAVIGTIGYGIETAVRGHKEQPWKEKSTVEERRERKLAESENALQTDMLKDKSFIPKTIFERNQ